MTAETETVTCEACGHECAPLLAGAEPSLMHCADCMGMRTGETVCSICNRNRKTVAKVCAHCGDAPAVTYVAEDFTLAPVCAACHTAAEEV